MTMDCLDMPRRQRMFRLDDRILDALDDVAANAGYSSANQFVETTLFNLLKAAGKIPADAQPLAETRGGKRPGAGKPKGSKGEGTEEGSIESSSDDEGN